ncbi:MAG: hypothetical protein ACYDD1_17160 [Caulobacteraceae bacterium]
MKLTDAARFEGRFRFLSGKRRDLPEDPHLTAWLKEISSSQPNEPRACRKIKAAEPGKVVRLPTATPTLVLNIPNERYTKNGLGLELKEAIVALHKLASCQAPISTWTGFVIPVGGNSPLMRFRRPGAAMMGHWSPTSFTQYRRQADRVRMSNDAGAMIPVFRDQAENAEVSARCLTEPAEGRT